MVFNSRLHVQKYLDDEKNESLSPETKKWLSQLDPFTVKLLLALPKAIIKQSGKFEKRDDEDVETSEVDLGWKKVGAKEFNDWKKIRTKTVDRKISKNFTCTTLLEDDFYGRNDKSLVLQIVEKIVKKLVFPLEDHIVEAPSDEESSRLLKDLYLNEGRGMPESYNKDFDLLSDESFSRMFFYGIGAPLLAAQEKVSKSVAKEFGPFQVDMPIHNLKVREGFRPYGARVHFNANQQVTAIFDYAKGKLFEPTHKEAWNRAKYLAKVTAMVLVTVKEHLVSTHLIAANTATRASTLELSPSHPIRRLLTIFTFRTTEVNSGAFGLLVPKNSLLHRGTAFEYSAIKQIFDTSYTESITFEPFSKRAYIPELIKLSNENKFPFIDQGEEYYDIVESFVREWLQASGEQAEDEQAMKFYNSVKESTKGQAYEVPDYRSQEDMVDVCSQIIFAATAYHELVGTVVDYSCLPNRAGFRVCENEARNDLQAFLIQAIIAATTNVGIPLLDSSFDKFFGVGGAPEWEMDLWRKFRNELKIQSKSVHDADESRGIEFKHFDPHRFECSVSV